MTETPSFSIADDYPEYRRDVAALCADFPGDYWRALEEQPPSGSYPPVTAATIAEVIPPADAPASEAILTRCAGLSG